MCGIFAYLGNKNTAADIVLNGLKRLEYRGYDSWGISVTDEKNPGNPLVILKKVGKIGNASVDRLPPSTRGIGHTRWATHGAVTLANAHPQADCMRSIVVVHNGIIENASQLKKDLRNKGHVFRSQTDTEVAAHLIEKFRNKLPFAEAVRKAFLKLQGLNALIAMEKNDEKLVAVRSGSPLVVGFAKGEHFLASDAIALLPLTRKVYFLEEGEMAVLCQNNIKVQSAKTGKNKAIRPLILNWSIGEVEKGRFPHFMLKEMSEQPAVLNKIAGLRQQNREKVAGMLKEASATFMVGCGSAAYACLAGSYLFSQIAKIRVNWGIASEFGYENDFLTPKTLLIALSQSGETMDTLEAVKEAKRRGAQIIALVNVVGSTLYREADVRITLEAGPEKAVATSKAFTAKLAQLLLLAYTVAGKSEEAKRILKKSALSTTEILEGNQRLMVRRLAARLKHHQHIYVIGRGLSYAIALETALKLKEISYIHAEGFASGELKHGVIALVEKKTPCIVFAPPDKTYEASLVSAMEMKTRGGHIIGISHKNHQVFDDFLKVADAKEATIIPSAVVGQTLAYDLALARGLDPDMPRNLAKSVTVR